MNRFTGRYVHALDAKSRVSVPRKLLEVLRKLGAEGEVMITRGLDGCLFVYTPAGFEAMSDEVDQKPVGDNAVREFARGFYSNAEACPIDRAGRLLLAPSLKEHANITDRVVFAGVGQRIELWSPAGWDARAAQSRDQYEAQAKEVFR